MTKVLLPIVIILAIILTLELTGVFGAHSTTPPAPPDVLPVINSFIASPSIISPGGSSTLSWTVTGATTVSIDQGVGYVTFTMGSKNVSPVTTTIYRLTASNATGSRSATTQVTVTGGSSPASAGLPVIDYFTASPSVINRGGSTTLSWIVENSTSVRIDNGVGSVASSGNTVTYPDSSTTYTLTAGNAVGWVTQTVKVTVTGGQSSVSGILPTSTSFANKTYTNNQYGFSVRYPTDWVERPELVSVDAVAAFGVPSFIPFVILYIIDADAPVTADWLVKSYAAQNNNNPKVLSPPTETTLSDGSKAIQSEMSYISQTGYEIKAFDIETDKGGERIRVMVGTIDAFAPYDEALFSEIAHAVRFR